jgi:uncharacterized protein (DUF486 family)
MIIKINYLIIIKKLIGKKDTNSKSISKGDLKVINNVFEKGIFFLLSFFYMRKVLINHQIKPQHFNIVSFFSDK